MTVLDAYAVLAYLADEVAAPEVQPLIEEGGVLAAMGLAEVVDHLIRRLGASEDDASLDVATLGLDRAVGIDAQIAAAAGRLRARHYHRTQCQVSLADCVAAEVARSTGRPLATADPHLLDVCHRESIPVVVLPAADGSRWSHAPGS